MAGMLGKFFDSVAASVQNLLAGGTPQQRASRAAQQLQQTVATLLFETARVDHDIRDKDLRIAEDCLCELFALTPQEVAPLLAHASQLKHRPTSYHPLVKIINDHFSATEKTRLVEYMWRVAHADNEVNMYEDHLVRKISELLYLPHREFIAAKHRARDHNR